MEASSSSLTVEQELKKLRQLENEHQRCQEQLRKSTRERYRSIRRLGECISNDVINFLLSGEEKEQILNLNDLRAPSSVSTSGNAEARELIQQQVTELQYLQTLLDHMMDKEHGVPFADRRYHFRMYQSCVVGREVVSWMVEKGWAVSRSRAVSLGRALGRLGVLKHVAAESAFEDRHLFYYLLPFPSSDQLVFLSPLQEAEILRVPNSARSRDGTSSVPSAMNTIPEQERFESSTLHESNDGSTALRNGCARDSAHEHDASTSNHAHDAPSAEPEQSLSPPQNTREGDNKTTDQSSSVGPSSVATSPTLSPISTALSSPLNSPGLAYMLPPSSQAWTFFKFTPLVHACSFGFPADLAFKIENAPDEPHRSDFLRQLHQRVRFLCNNNPKLHHNKAWNLIQSRGGIDTYIMDKEFSIPKSCVDPRATRQAPVDIQYSSKVVKTVGKVRVSPRRFIKEYRDLRTRRLWLPLCSQARVVQKLSANTRIVHWATASPLKSLWPRDTCVLEDWFTTDRGKTHVLIEISVNHPSVPPAAGFVRAEYIFVARILQAIPNQKHYSLLTHISQVDLKGEVPDWCVERWLGQHVFGKHTRRSSTHGGSMQSTASIGWQDFDSLAVLGRGVHSKILQVRHRKSGALYAMKVMRKSDTIRTQSVAAIIRERNILAAARNPFVVRLHYSFQTSHKLYMVMDYVGGGDMFTYLQRKGRFPLHTARVYAAELVVALRFLHANGIVHRDIKPENILICEDGHLKLCDFGLAKDGFTKQNRRSYSLVGTQEYIAPEMLLGQPHGIQVDWWQLGIVLHEMLTGQHPFFAENTFQLHHNVMHSAPKLANGVAMNPQVASFVRGLLHKSPSKRLGASQGDVEAHPFFKNINWEYLVAKQIDPQFKPIVRYPGDTVNFDENFTNQIPVEREQTRLHKHGSNPEAPARGAAADYSFSPPGQESDYFYGFDYNPSPENV